MCGCLYPIYSSFLDSYPLHPPASRHSMASPLAFLSTAPSKRKSTGTQQLGDRHKETLCQGGPTAGLQTIRLTRAGAKATSALPVDESDDDDDVEAQILAHLV